MPDPADEFGVPNTLWNDEFQGMGGINFGDMLAQQQAAQQRQAEAAARQAQMAQVQEQPSAPEFMDWPTFQFMAMEDPANKESDRDIYGGYLEALDYQLQQMGFSPEEAAQGVVEFQRRVPRPLKDEGFFGNLLDSFLGGAASGTRAVAASTAAATGNNEALAGLAGEQAGAERNAALERFNRALTGDGEGLDTGWWDTIKNVAAAGVREPEGMLNFFVEQLAQSYPVLVAGGGGALTGALGGPVGAVAGGIAGTGAGSLALDTGATILEGLVSGARQRGIDPNDRAALAGLLEDPTVRDDIIASGLRHGIPVATMDAAVAALSFGLGRTAVTMARAGRRGMAGAATAGALGGEILGGAGGEALGQLNQSGEITSKQDVVLEALGELGPGVVTTAAGAITAPRSLRRPTPGATPPPVTPDEDIDEADLPGGREPTAPRMDTAVRPGVMIVAPDGSTFEGTPDNIAAYAEAQLRNIQVDTPTVEEITIGDVKDAPPDVEVGDLSVEEITIGDVKGARPDVEVSELPVEEINITGDNVGIAGLLPLLPPQRPTLAVSPEGVAGTPEAVQQQRDAERLAALAPQLSGVDVNDVQSLRDRMRARDIALTDDMADLWLEEIANAPKGRKQEAIAAAVDYFGDSTDANADALSLELIRIAHTLRPDRKVPTPAEAQAAVAALATEINVPIEQVVPIVSQALAQEIVDAVVATSQSKPVAATPAVPDAPVRTRRSLKRGEPIPAPTLGSLVGQLGGSDQTQGGAGQAARQPRRSLRAGVAPQGAGQGGAGANARGGAGGTGARNPRILPDDTTGIGGVPRVVPGRAYGASGAIDEANTAALQRMAAEARAKAKTGGLSKKALAKAKKVSKEQYEKDYPGRNFDDDADKIISAERVDVVGEGDAALSDKQLLALQHMSANEVMQYVASVAPTPLMRIIAREIGTLNLPTVFRLGALTRRSAGRYAYAEAANGAATEDVVIIDPASNAGRNLSSILHEYVHAATLHRYLNPNTPEQHAAAKTLDDLFVYTRSIIGGSDESRFYGMTNTTEFIAEALSNPNFQARLKDIALPDAPKVSMWTAFKSAVLKLLGVKTDTVLAHVLAAAEDVFSADRNGVLTDAGVRKLQANLTEKQNAVVPSTAMVGTKDGARAFIAYRKSKTDPKSSFTLYPVTPDQPRGVKAAGMPDMTREQVEEYIRNAGAEVLAPVADTQASGGTPKNTSTKMVGFAPNGDLQVVAFEQKDGTWTYYESTGDVRTDPDATVYKGLTKDQAQRYLTAKNVQPTAPKAGAVKPNGVKPTAIGYTPPSSWRVTYQNAEAAFQALGDSQEEAGVPDNQRVDYAAVARNTRVEEKIREVNKQYVDPAAKAGTQISKEYNKTQVEIEEVLRQLHKAERATNKIRQFQRGNLDPTALAAKVSKLQADVAAAEKYIRDLQNPRFVDAVKRDLAPKMKALADNTIDMNAQYGFITRETAENIKRAYDFYVPFQTGTRTVTAKAATGASTTGDVSFARLQEQAMRTIARGEQNKIRKLVMDIAESSGIVNTKTNEGVVSVGASAAVRYDPETNSLNEGVDNHVFDDDTIVVYVGGNRIPMTITDDALLQAMHPYKGEERKTVGTFLIGLAGRLNHIVSIGKTALSPAFAPFNFMRDMGTAMINLPKGVSRVQLMKQLANPETYWAAFRNTFADALGGEMAGDFAAARKAGSFISQRAYIGLDVIANSVDAAFRPTVMQSLKRHKEGSFKLLTAWSQSLESATRYAVYKAAKDSGQSDIAASYAAKTSSVNFENRGLKNLSHLYIFANAKMQGLSAIHRTLSRASGVNAAAGVMSLLALGFLAGMLGYKYSEKDKDGKSKYAKIPDYKKDSLVVLQEGAPGVPIPQEIAPFYVVGNTIADAVYGGKTLGEATSRMFTSITNAVWPGNVPQQEVAGHKARPVEFLLRAIVPSQFAPAVDIALNRTTFGSELVSGLDLKKKQGMPGYEMGSANENELAVNAAKGLYDMTGGAINAAPQQLRALNTFFNPFAETGAFFRDIMGAREPKYEGDIVNPIARKFTAAATPFYDQDHFDELLAKATQAQFQAKARGIESLSLEEQALAKSASMLERVQNDTRALFKNAKVLSREQIKLRQARKQELLLDGIRRYNELRDRMPRK